MRKSAWVVIGCSVWTILTTPQNGRASAASTEMPRSSVRAMVSIPPQAFFVKRIGGEMVTVEVLLPPGQSHETYEPTPQMMTHLAEADIFFAIGVPFEKRLLSKIGSELTGLKIVDTRKGVKFLPMTHPDEHYSSGDTTDNAQSSPDPHIWLDPEIVKIQATDMCTGLSEIDPTHRTAYEQNLLAFQRQLDETDKTIRELLAPFAGKTVYVFHPAFGYFTHAYGLRQAAIEVDGKEPSARQLADLIDQARRDSVRVVFVQPQFPKKQVVAIADALNARVVVLDPLSEDYLTNLRDIADKIAESLGKGATVGKQ